MDTNLNALDAYFVRIASIRTKLEKIQQLADDHFGHDADSIQWDSVGDLGRVESVLDEVLVTFASP